MRIIIFLLTTLSLFINAQNKVGYKIYGDFPANEPIDPQSITLTGKDIRVHTFLDGKYILRIEQPGYRNVKRVITLPNGDGKYFITHTMITIPRKIDFSGIVSEEMSEKGKRTITYCKNIKMIFHHVHASNKKIVAKEGDFIKPGAYFVEITKPGYFRIKKKVYIWPDTRTYRIKTFLSPRPRKLKVHITSKGNPSKKLICQTILMQGKKAQKITKFTRVIPGKYNIEIKKAGYKTKFLWIHILAGDTPYLIKDTLDTIKKETEILENKREIQLHIERNIQLDPHYSPKVYLINEHTSIAYEVANGNKVESGMYVMKIECPGYIPIIRKIYIPRSLEVYHIKAKLEAIKRALAFIIKDEKGFTTYAKEIYINGKKVKATDKYLPGSKLSIELKWKNKNIQRTIVVKPGIGIFVVKISLEDVKFASFSTRKNHIVLDGIKYPYEYYLNGKKVEKEAIQIQHKDHHYHIKIRIQNPQSTLVLYGGYLRTKGKKVSQKMNGVGRFHHYDAKKLIEYLKIFPPSSLIQKMSYFMRRYKSRKFIRTMPKKDFQKMIHFLGNISYTKKEHIKMQQEILQIFKQYLQK